MKSLGSIKRSSVSSITTSGGGQTLEAAKQPEAQCRWGSSSDAVLKNLSVCPIPASVARKVMQRHHYLHSMPGGTHLSFGVFSGPKLAGAITLGAGPYNAPSLVKKAQSKDCMTLTRLWLSDELPKNAESRVLGQVMRELKKYTKLKFLLSYADPAQGHVGTIYQATNWVYTGLSTPTPHYDLGDGKLRHSRSLAHVYGTHPLKHFSQHGVPIRMVKEGQKHRYVYFLDPSWRSRLKVPELPYPKKDSHEDQ